MHNLHFLVCLLPCPNLCLPKCRSPILAAYPTPPLTPCLTSKPRPSAPTPSTRPPTRGACWWGRWWNRQRDWNPPTPPPHRHADPKQGECSPQEGVGHTVVARAAIGLPRLAGHPPHPGSPLLLSGGIIWESSHPILLPKDCRTNWERVEKIHDGGGPQFLTCFSTRRLWRSKGVTPPSPKGT